jgi:hypothetical protein
MNSIRRDLLQRGFSLAALTMVIDYDIRDNDLVRSWLARVSRWNDRIREAIFKRNKPPRVSEVRAVRYFRDNGWDGASECAGDNHDRVDTQTALLQQTLMAFWRADETPPRERGFPFKRRIPATPGFRNPKLVTAIHVTDRMARGDWPDHAYNGSGRS